MTLRFFQNSGTPSHLFHLALSRPSRVMAVPALVGPRTLAESLKLGSSDLRFTLSRNDVPGEMQAHFFENGVLLALASFLHFSEMKQILSTC